MSERSGPRWLFISHAYGGGVQQHVDDLTALIRDELDGVVWLLQPRDERSVRLTWCGEDSGLDIPLAHDQLSAVIPGLAGALGIQRLHFHHLAGLPASILELPTALGLPFDFTFHDFHTVCPQSILLHGTEASAAGQMFLHARRAWQIVLTLGGWGSRIGGAPSASG